MTDILHSRQYQNAITTVNKWFNKKNCKLLDFQIQTWNNYLNSRSGLIHASTGTGKTLTVWMGPITDTLSRNNLPTNGVVHQKKPIRRQDTEPFKIL